MIKLKRSCQVLQVLWCFQAADVLTRPVCCVNVNLMSSTVDTSDGLWLCLWVSPCCRRCLRSRTAQPWSFPAPRGPRPPGETGWLPETAWCSCPSRGWYDDGTSQDGTSRLRSPEEGKHSRSAEAEETLISWDQLTDTNRTLQILSVYRPQPSVMHWPAHIKTFHVRYIVFHIMMSSEAF